MGKSFSKKSCNGNFSLLFCWKMLILLIDTIVVGRILRLQNLVIEALGCFFVLQNWMYSLETCFALIML